MQPRPPLFDPHALDAFVALAGARTWSARIAEIHRLAAGGPRAGLATRQRHAVELAIERLRGPLLRPASTPELHAARLAGEAVALDARLTPHGRTRLRERLHAGLRGDGTLMSLFHLLRTALLQRERGFQVGFAGFEEDASYDLLLTSGMVQAEVVCDVVSAEEGRLVHRGAWSRLADRMDADLQDWLTRNPGRYLLKMTLPMGLQGGLHEQAAEGGALASLHMRIRRLLETRGRREHDAGLVLRLDPLVLHHGQSGQPALWSSLRREFGPEAHLSITTAGNGVFAMAAHAGRENEIATAVRRRLAVIAPARLTGTRPGILAMFIEDTDRGEWRGLRERLELEGEARQFLAHKEARLVIAVTCASRFELFGMSFPHAAEDGELRFRNPAHPDARAAALAPAVLSSV
jgi:hypothetical protein